MSTSTGPTVTTTADAALQKAKRDYEAECADLEESRRTLESATISENVDELNRRVLEEERRRLKKENSKLKDQFDSQMAAKQRSLGSRSDITRSSTA